MNMHPFKITGVTVSLELSDSNFGNGSKRYAAFKAETPAELPATVDEALLASLDLHLAAFESVYGTAAATAAIPAEDYNALRAAFKRRRALIIDILKKHPIEEAPSD